MSEEQAKILNEIADRIEKSADTKENARDLLVRAGILTKKGNVKQPYKGIFTRSDQK